MPFRSWYSLEHTVLIVWTFFAAAVSLRKPWNDLVSTAVGGLDTSLTSRVMAAPLACTKTPQNLQGKSRNLYLPVILIEWNWFVTRFFIPPLFLMPCCIAERSYSCENDHLVFVPPEWSLKCSCISFPAWTTKSVRHQTQGQQVTQGQHWQNFEVCNVAY